MPRLSYKEISNIDDHDDTGAEHQSDHDADDNETKPKRHAIDFVGPLESVR